MSSIFQPSNPIFDPNRDFTVKPDVPAIPDRYRNREIFQTVVQTLNQRDRSEFEREPVSPELIKNKPLNPNLLVKTGKTAVSIAKIAPRIPLRVVEEVVNSSIAVINLFRDDKLDQDFDLDERFLGKAGKGEKFVSDVGAFIAGFAIAGAALKLLKGGALAATAFSGQRAQKTVAGVQQSFSILEKKKMLKIAADGALRGAIVDFVNGNKDSDDVFKRLQNSLVGVGIGTALNPALHYLVGPLVKGAFKAGINRAKWDDVLGGMKKEVVDDWRQLLGESEDLTPVVKAVRFTEDGTDLEFNTVRGEDEVDEIFNDKFDALEKSTEKIQKELADKEEIIQKTEADRDLLKESSAKRGKAVKNRNRQIKKLNKEIEQLKQQTKELNAARDENLETIGDLRKQLEEANAPKPEKEYSDVKIEEDRSQMEEILGRVEANKPKGLWTKLKDFLTNTNDIGQATMILSDAKNRLALTMEGKIQKALRFMVQKGELGLTNEQAFDGYQKELKEILPDITAFQTLLEIYSKVKSAQGKLLVSNRQHWRKVTNITHDKEVDDHTKDFLLKIAKMRDLAEQASDKDFKKKFLAWKKEELINREIRLDTWIEGLEGEPTEAFPKIITDLLSELRKNAAGETADSGIRWTNQDAEGLVQETLKQSDPQNSGYKRPRNMPAEAEDGTLSVTEEIPPTREEKIAQVAENIAIGLKDYDIQVQAKNMGKALEEVAEDELTGATADDLVIKQLDILGKNLYEAIVPPAPKGTRTGPEILSVFQEVEVLGTLRSDTAEILDGVGKELKQAAREELQKFYKKFSDKLDLEDRLSPEKIDSLVESALQKQFVQLYDEAYSRALGKVKSFINKSKINVNPQEDPLGYISKMRELVEDTLENEAEAFPEALLVDRGGVYDSIMDDLTQEVLEPANDRLAEQVRAKITSELKQKFNLKAKLGDLINLSRQSDPDAVRKGLVDLGIISEKTGAYDIRELKRQINEVLSPLMRLAELSDINNTSIEGLERAFRDGNITSIIERYLKKVEDVAPAPKDRAKRQLMKEHETYKQQLEELLKKPEVEVKAGSNAVEKIKKLKAIKGSIRHLESMINQTESYLKTYPDSIEAAELNIQMRSVIAKLDTLHNNQSLLQEEKTLRAFQKEVLDNAAVKFKEALEQGREVEFYKQIDDEIEAIFAEVEKDFALDEGFKNELKSKLSSNLRNSIMNHHETIISQYGSNPIAKKILQVAENELENLLKTGDDAKIYDHFKRKQQNRPEEVPDIAILKERLRELKKEGRDAAKNLEEQAFQEFEERVAKSMVELGDIELGSPNKLTQRLNALQMYRMNAGLLGLKTLFISAPSNIVQLFIYQPLRRAYNQILKIPDLDVDGTRMTLSKWIKIDPKVQNQLRDQQIQEAVAAQRAWGKMGSHITFGLRAAKETWKMRGKDSFLGNSSAWADEPLKEGDQAIMRLNRDENWKRLQEMYGKKNDKISAVIDRFIARVEANESPTGAIEAVFDIFFSGMYRTLGAMDAPFKVVNTMQTLSEKAFIEAAQKGIPEDKLDEFVQKSLEKNIKFQDNNVYWRQQEEAQDLLDTSLAVTMNQDYEDKLFSRLMKSVSDNLHIRNEDSAPMASFKFFVKQFIFPFVKIPTVSAQFLIDVLPPVAIGKKVASTLEQLKPMKDYKALEEQLKLWRRELAQISQPQGQFFNAESSRKELVKRITEGEAELEKLEGLVRWHTKDINEKFMTGISLTLVGGIMANTGYMTGTGSWMTPEEQNIARQSGWKPNMLRIRLPNGKLWEFNYEKIEPFGSLLSLVADISNWRTRLDYLRESGTSVDFEDEEMIDMITTVYHSLANMAQNKFYLQGVKKFLELFDPQQALEVRKTYNNIEAYFADAAASMFPRVYKDFQNIGQEYQSVAVSLGERFKDRAIGGELGQYRRNIFGEKMGKFWDKGFWNPLLIGESENDPLLQRLTGVTKLLKHYVPYRVQGRNTQLYRDKDGRTLFDAWQEYLSSYRFRNKTLRQAVEDDLKYSELNNLSSWSSDENTETTASVIRGTLNVYRRRSFEDFISANSENFFNNDGQAWNQQLEALSLPGSSGLAETLFRQTR